MFKFWKKKKVEEPPAKIEVPPEPPVTNNEKITPDLVPGATYQQILPQWLVVQFVFDPIKNHVDFGFFVPNSADVGNAELLGEMLYNINNGNMKDIIKINLAKMATANPMLLPFMEKINEAMLFSGKINSIEPLISPKDFFNYEDYRSN